MQLTLHQFGHEVKRGPETHQAQPTSEQVLREPPIDHRRRDASQGKSNQQQTRRGIDPRKPEQGGEDEPLRYKKLALAPAMKRKDTPKANEQIATKHY